MAKTAHCKFPVEHIQKHVFNKTNRHSDTVKFTATMHTVKSIAHGWNEPGKPKKPKKAVV